MNAIVRLIVCLFILFGWENAALHSVLAQNPPSDPSISLTVKDEPLVEALDTIAEQTGYQFNLTPQWEDHPVSATINNLPLGQGLKRLLRSLNHTILWEDDNVVTIKVYGKATAGSSGDISFAAPPQETIEEDEPPSEPDNEPVEDVDQGVEDDKLGGPEEALDQPGQENDRTDGEPPAMTGQRPKAPKAEE